MKGRLIVVALCVLATLLGAAAAAAQSSLAEAAQRARAAWLAHDPQALVGHSGSVVLRIPGADPGSPLDRAQVAELLRRHWGTAVERSLVVNAIREVEPGKGYVELERRYVVSGTSDERRETIFLGFRRGGGGWLLVEVRGAL